MKQMNKYTILFYSKFSKSSQALLDTIQSGGNDLLSMLLFRTICVDSKIARTKLTQDKKLEITSVPCILIVDTNGTVSKFEGDNAFNWAQEIMTKWKNVQTDTFPIQQPIDTELYQSLPKTTSSNRHSKKTAIKNLISSDEDEQSESDPKHKNSRSNIMVMAANMAKARDNEHNKKNIST